MDVRCERCRARYTIDDAQVGPAGLALQCTACGHTFKVVKKELVVTLPVKPGERAEAVPASAPIPASAAPVPALGNGDAREWRIRQRSGRITPFRELSSLQRWIVEGKVSRDDEISRATGPFKRLGDIPDLDPFFKLVEAARRPAAPEPGPGAELEAAPPDVEPGAGPLPAPDASRAEPGGDVRGVVADEPTWAMGAPLPLGERGPSARSGPVEGGPGSGRAEPVEGRRASSSRQRRRGMGGRILFTLLLLAVVGAGASWAAGWWRLPGIAWQGEVAPSGPVGAMGTSGGPAFDSGSAKGGPYAQADRTAGASGTSGPSTEAPSGPSTSSPTGPIAEAPSGPAPAAPSGPSTESPTGPVDAAQVDPATAPTGPAPAAVSPAAEASTGPAPAPAAPASAAAPSPPSAAPAATPAAGSLAGAGAAGTAAAAGAPAGEVVAAAPPPKKKPSKSAATQQASASPDEDPKKLFARAERDRLLDDPRSAVAYYDRVLEAEPKNGRALVGRGLCQVDLGRYAEARKSFEAALKIVPDSAEAVMGMAEASRWQGRTDEAVRWYERYLADHPDGKEADVARNAIEELRRAP
ncbi:MAG: tetratricopeptide repeat protein [Anaeromyxobacter sp.]